MRSYYLTSSTAIVPFCIISFLLLVSLLGTFAPEKIVFALADFNFGEPGTGDALQTPRMSRMVL